MKVQIYLNFNGTCATAFKFYETTFNGKIEFMQTFGETPAAEHMPPEAQNLIMHASMKIGESEIMGSDAPGDHYEKPQGISVSLNLDNPEEADRIFAALAQGGTIQMPIEKTFWAQRFGMVTDQFGTPWMINCN